MSMHCDATTLADELQRSDDIGTELMMSDPADERWSVREWLDAE